MSSMTADGTMLATIVAALRVSPKLSGVYADAPARAAFPYVRVESTEEVAWDCSSHDGSEIIIRATIWDDQPSRLLDIERDVEDRLGEITPSDTLPWYLASLRVRSRESGGELSQPWSRRLFLQARLCKPRG